MRRLLMSLLLLFLAAPVANATETDNEPGKAVAPEVVPSVAGEAEPGGEAGMLLDEIIVEERVAEDGAAAAQLGPRGSFWWIVGAIVVAGIILAVVL